MRKCQLRTIATRFLVLSNRVRVVPSSQPYQARDVRDHQSRSPYHEPDLSAPVGSGRSSSAVAWETISGGSHGSAYRVSPEKSSNCYTINLEWTQVRSTSIAVWLGLVDSGLSAT